MMAKKSNCALYGTQFSTNPGGLPLTFLMTIVILLNVFDLASFMDRMVIFRSSLLSCNDVVPGGVVEAFNPRGRWQS